MFEHKTIRNLDDFFLKYAERPQRCTFFYRINGYNDEIADFLMKYYEAARDSGVVIEGRIPNPTEQNLSYYNEMMGMGFRFGADFIADSLKKWMPRMTDAQRSDVASGMHDVFESMRKSGKNDNVLKNAYIKYMCWLYYKFERVISQLGRDNVPKILYDGTVSSYELNFLAVLSRAGCDIILLQREGDAGYRKLDPESAFSDELRLAGMGPFPEGFSVNYLTRQIQQRQQAQRLRGAEPETQRCTNAWITGGGMQQLFDDILKPAALREQAMNAGIPPVFRGEGEAGAGSQISSAVSAAAKASSGSGGKFFYNCFARVSGVEDKVTYLNELYQFKNSYSAAGRPLVIVERQIPKPTADEIASVRRKNYSDAQQMIADLSSNLKSAGNGELQKIMRTGFVDVMLDEIRREGAAPPGTGGLGETDGFSRAGTGNANKAGERSRATVSGGSHTSKGTGVPGAGKADLNRLTGRAVYLLCWLKRYQSELFHGISGGCQPRPASSGSILTDHIGCFIYLGGCIDKNEALFLKYLARLPVDVLILAPDLNRKCCLDDPELYEVHGGDSLAVDSFPESGGVRMATAAYHAERELDSVMYQDSGLYRSQQFAKAVSVTLQTIYEEIAILWEQELKYRPNFSVNGDVVNIPVIFSKVSGVKDGMVQQYWADVRKLVTEDTFVITEAPFIRNGTPNPAKAHVTEFFRAGRVQKAKIKAHSCYQYQFLREEIQDYILEKLQLLIDRKLIRGTFENGTEYTIVATVLNLNTEIMRMIQKFDFTKKNPKLIYINTTEHMISLEDSILIAFLNLVGFDIIFFVPTGYQCVEKYFKNSLLEEHQIGEYVYDLAVPHSIRGQPDGRRTLMERFFNRGR